jgi:putrescine aminotransferase
MTQNTSKIADLRARDARHHIHPFNDQAALRREGVRVIASADGVWLTDTEGNKFLDAFSGLWNVSVGYGRKAIADAVFKQMQELPFYNTFFKSTHVPAIELAEKLASLAPGFNRSFFTNSGSEANDTIIRLVRHYWKLKGQPQKEIFIARKNGYHGSTIAGASLGGMGYMHEQGNLPIPGIIHVAQPYWWGEGGDMTEAEFGAYAANEVVRAIDQAGAENVAAFIGEPIQGAGGVIMPPSNYWAIVAKACRERNVLLISDEVICGFGRTGEWFGSNYYGFIPDIMTIAKGITSGYLPMGGVMLADHIGEVIDAGGDFSHGYTTSGHPACCAAALANLKIIEEEKLVDRVKYRIGPYLAQKWQTLADHEMVGEVRIVGMLGALELTPDKKTRAKFPKLGDAGIICRDFAYQEGLVLRATGDTMLIAPPFVLSETEADQLVMRARRALDRLVEAMHARGWY